MLAGGANLLPLSLIYGSLALLVSAAVRAPGMVTGVAGAHGNYLKYQNMTQGREGGGGAGTRPGGHRAQETHSRPKRTLPGHPLWGRGGGGGSHFTLFLLPRWLIFPSRPAALSVRSCCLAARF